MNRLRALGSDKITLSIERAHISPSCVQYSTNTDNYLSHLTALTLNFRLGLVSVSWVKSTHTSWMCWGRTDEDDITQRGLVRNRNACLVGTIWRHMGVCPRISGWAGSPCKHGADSSSIAAVAGCVRLPWARLSGEGGRRAQD